MKAQNRVRIPVTVTYTGYYVFEYQDTFDMDRLMDEDLEPSPEYRERHWTHGLQKLKGAIEKEIEEYGVDEALDSVDVRIVVGLGPDEERKLRAIFDRGYAELEEEPLEDEEEAR